MLFSVNTKSELLPFTSLTLREKQLVSCLTYIIKSYFTLGRTLVISSQGTYRNVQQELIAEIHTTSIWPVVNVDWNISIKEGSGFIDRGGSYIILITHGNIKSFQVECNGLTEGRNNKFTSLRNSETRFVVAGVIEFPMSQQTDIIIYFSKFRIYNCIIVSQEHFVIDNVYSRPIKPNDVDAAVLLGVYTSFP